MKSHSITSLVAVAVIALGGATAAAQGHADHAKTSGPTAQGKMGMEHGHMAAMMREPHHMLAMGYHHTLAAFSRMLEDHARQGTTIDTAFARDAVAEMRRSFDLFTKHHGEHMKTMSVEMKSKMAPMMEKMGSDLADIRTQLGTLEMEVAKDAPDAVKIAAAAGVINAHFAEMMKMHDAGKGEGMGHR